MISSKINIKNDLYIIFQANIHGWRAIQVKHVRQLRASNSKKILIGPTKFLIGFSLNFCTAIEAYNYGLFKIFLLTALE